jgi:hypothetical protein
MKPDEAVMESAMADSGGRGFVRRITWLRFQRITIVRKVVGADESLDPAQVSNVARCFLHYEKGAAGKA